jgi:hypothetical protein
VGCLTKPFPLRRFTTRMVIRCAVTNTTAASYEIPCSAEFYMSKGCWNIRFPAPAMASRVSTRPSRYLPRDRPPLHLRSTGSSSPELRVSIECVANRILRDPCEPRNPPLRFSSHSRHQLRESTNSRLPTTYLMVRPRRFSRPRRVTPLGALQAYFILLPRAGFAFQGFSPKPSRFAFRRPFPS